MIVENDSLTVDVVNQSNESLVSDSPSGRQSTASSSNGNATVTKRDGGKDRAAQRKKHIEFHRWVFDRGCKNRYMEIMDYYNV
jgi:hypothetical protein